MLLKKLYISSMIAFATTGSLIANTQSPRFEGQFGLAYSKLDISHSNYSTLDQKYALGLTGGGHAILGLLRNAQKIQ